MLVHAGSPLPSSPSRSEMMNASSSMQFLGFLSQGRVEIRLQTEKKGCRRTFTGQNWDAKRQSVSDSASACSRPVSLAPADPGPHWASLSLNIRKLSSQTLDSPCRMQRHSAKPSGTLAFRSTERDITICTKPLPRPNGEVHVGGKARPAGVPVLTGRTSCIRGPQGNAQKRNRETPLRSWFSHFQLDGVHTNKNRVEV